MNLSTMLTLVCQNPLPCYDSPLTDTAATLKLKVAALTPPAALGHCRKLGAADHSPRNKFGTWGFLQKNSNESGDADCIYTHPSAESSSFSKLCPKSLELCTENLGSESGSDTVSDCSSIFLPSPPLSHTSNSGDDHKRANFNDWNQKRTTPANAHRRQACQKIKNFPPPLTTMSGSSSLQVRRHREGGRLVIEAVEGPFMNPYLQAERSDGRLKLCFTAASSGKEEEEEENEGECGGGGVAEEEIEEPRNELVSEMEEFDGESNVMDKFQRLSRCKEGGHGNKGLCSNWKPALWVATS